MLEWHDLDGNLVVRRAVRFSSPDLHWALFPKGTPKVKAVPDVKVAIRKYILRRQDAVCDEPAGQAGRKRRCRPASRSERAIRALGKIPVPKKQPDALLFSCKYRRKVHISWPVCSRHPPFKDGGSSLTRRDARESRFDRGAHLIVECARILAGRFDRLADHDMDTPGLFQQAAPGPVIHRVMR